MSRNRISRLALLSILLSTASVAQITAPVPNKSVHVGWGGYINTNAFFLQAGANHTLSGWLLPQFTAGYQGTIFGNVLPPGSLTTGETLDIGIGHLNNGVGGYPHLYIQYGAQRVTYHAPQIEAGKWFHLAIARSASTMHLYLNGQYLIPANFAACQTQSNAVHSARNALSETAFMLKDHWTTMVQLANTSLNECLNTNYTPEIHHGSTLPAGVLQIGRTGAKANVPLAESQWYGLVDDIAVFNRTLTPNEIASIFAAKRLNGAEANLIYALSFDKSDGILAQAPILNSPKSYTGAVYEDVAISANRSNTDAARFDDAQLLFATTIQEKLPLPVGEAWKVVQGFDQPFGSHFGSWTFAYDFAKKPTDEYYPNGTIGAPVRTPESGVVVAYKTVNTYTSHNEDTYVAIRRLGGEVVYFRHLDAIPNLGGICDANTHECRPLVGNALTLPANTQVGIIGDRAKHLHTGARNRVDGVSIPVSYTTYWVSDDAVTWWPVLCGIPKTGQYVKRMN